MALQDRSSTLAALKTFTGIQQARAECYAQLQSGFQSMLKTRHEGAYLRLLQRSTQLFQALSQDAVAVEQKLRSDFNEAQLAGLVRVVQENERKKLRLTLSLQALKQAHAFESFSWQNEGQESAALDGPQTGLDISAVSLAQCGCQGAGANAAPEATQQEWSQACAEATQGLQAAIDNINDVMEELRYAVADLAGLDS